MKIINFISGIFILLLSISSARPQSAIGIIPQWTSIPATLLKTINSNTLKYANYPPGIKDSNDIDEIMIVVADDFLDSQGNILIAKGTPVQTTVKREISKQRAGGSIDVLFKSTTATDGQQILLTGNYIEKGKSRMALKSSMVIIATAAIVTGAIYTETGENDIYAAAGVIGGLAMLLPSLLVKAAPATIFNSQVITNVYSSAPYKIKVTSENATANNIISASNNANDTTNQFRGGGDPLKGLNVSKKEEMIIGDYYALIIGIDKYTGGWQALKNSVHDAKTIATLLKDEYKTDSIKTLYDEQATREHIIREMEWLIANVKEKDNVLIYYSGHGEFRKDMNKGFWVPADAKTAASTSNYISNSDIQTFLSAIKSKHTLLVSDACFSGDIFKGNTISVPFEESQRYYNEVHNLPSRQALTSGGIEPVMDGGKDGHSIFAYYFLKALTNNNNKFYDANQLYSNIKIPVTNNSEQSPQFQAIKNAGDEGGQFIFIKKEK